MELKANFALVIWILPFYLSLAIGAFLPGWSFQYVFFTGLSITVGGLFVQIFVYQYIARGLNLLRLTIDYQPLVISGNSTKYWGWGMSDLQLWWKQEPKEEPYGRWTACWLPLVRPIVHPKYNGPKVRIWWVKFVYEGKWNDIIKGLPGLGVYSNSIVDIPHVDRLWVSEMVGETLPYKKGVAPVLNHIPPLITQGNYAAYAPVFFIQRATGTIDKELLKLKEQFQLAGYVR